MGFYRVERVYIFAVCRRESSLPPHFFCPSAARVEVVPRRRVCAASRGWTWLGPTRPTVQGARLLLRSALLLLPRRPTPTATGDLVGLPESRRRTPARARAQLQGRAAARPRARARTRLPARARARPRARARAARARRLPRQLSLVKSKATEPRRRRRQALRRSMQSLLSRQAQPSRLGASLPSSLPGSSSTLSFFLGTDPRVRHHPRLTVPTDALSIVPVAAAPSTTTRVPRSL